MSKRFALKENLGVTPHIEALLEGMTLEQVYSRHDLLLCMPLPKVAATQIVKGEITVLEAFGKLQIH